MTTKREYAISLGLAKPGKGRLSAKAQEAINKAISEGMVFEEKVKTFPVPKLIGMFSSDSLQSTDIKRIPKPPPAKNTAPAINTINIKQRENKLIWGIDKGTKPGQSDLVICFDTCAGCNKTIQYCIHDNPILPKWINSDVYWEKP